jgi:CubicO group peptidase (beta-lactamase class C family)
MSAPAESYDREQFRKQFAAAYQALEKGIAERAFPGCAFGVFANGQVLGIDALGRQTYDADSPAITPDTVYDLASVSKVVATTAAAMLLWQRGGLDLDEPLAELMPGFIIGRDPAEKARTITLRMLLAHSAGLPSYLYLYKTCDSPAALLRSLLTLPIETLPGTRSEYSDFGFILLGKAIEILSGELLSSFAMREIFAPLGMLHTRFCPTAAERPQIPPTEEDKELRKRVIQGEVQDEHAWLLKGGAGHAGVFSNVADLLRFSEALLKPGTLFTAEAISTFSKRQVPPVAPEGSSRALGWDTPSEPSSSGKYFSPHSIGHLGFSGTSLWIDMEIGVSVVLLTNRTWPDRKPEGIRAIRPIFHDAAREALK